MSETMAREPSRSDPPRWLQRTVVFHLAVLIVGLSWWFGGQAPSARQALLLWGSAGGMLFLMGLMLALRSRRAALASTVLLPLGPLLLYDALVLASAFNPSMTPIAREGATYFVVTDPPFAWLPSSARPSLSLRELWQFNGIVLSCFNAFFLVQRRRLLRRLLAIAAGNALLLAVFGTFQKLIGAKGLWFGLVESPQSRFFATFIYHNHWGAFTLLNSAICLGLLFRAWQRNTHRDIWHSPLTAGAVATLLLAATIPLSSSRSSTLLAAALLLGALGHALTRIIRERRAQQQSAAGPVVAVSLAALLAIGGIGYLGRDVIAQRARTTAQQLTTSSGKNAFGSYQENYVDARARLYRDTWRMAMQRPYAGWGLESFATVFRIYDSSPYPLKAGGQFRTIYTEAHSDWLQAIAETGFVGTALLVALGGAPLWAARRQLLTSPVTRYLLAGCGLILLYAWVEFPLANPSVMVGFWACLYIASRYAVLDHAARNGQTNR